MEQVTTLVKMLGDTLLESGSTDVAISEPITAGKYKLLVLTKTSVGFGAGGGTGEGMSPDCHHHHKKPALPKDGAGVRVELMVKGKGTGLGAGGAVKVRPVGVIVLGPDGVRVLPIPDKPGLLDKLFEKIPQLVERLAPLMPEHKSN